MNLKRAVGFSVLSYVATFVAGMIICVITGFNPTSSATIPLALCYPILYASAILVSIFAFLYLRSSKVKADAKQGLLFALTVIVVSLLLDSVMAITVIATGSKVEDFLSIYDKSVFWLSLVIILSTCTLIGEVMGQKKK